jgi:hypothetical protein
LLIPLSDPIWSRLYGPYGVQDVNRVLAQLEHVWTAELSNTLYWEMLFHQDDLYPVTFAALPWLWQMVGRRIPPDRDALIFFSMVLLCAGRGEAGHGKYLGLSLEVGDHAKAWLPSETRLRPDDMQTLARLEIWFSENAEEIATACLEAVTADDAYAAAVLSAGFCGLRGCDAAANLLQMWADGHDWEEIKEDVTLSAQDISTLTALWHRLNDKNSEIDSFIKEYVGLTPHDSRQLDLDID